MDSLLVVLQDSVTQLQAENRLALQAGYNSAFSGFRDLSERYVAELRRPGFSLGWTVGLCLGSAGAGVLIGTILKN